MSEYTGLLTSRQTGSAGQPCQDHLRQSARPRPSLTRRTEIRLVHADNGSEYLSILVRKPLTADEILCVQEFLDAIDPGHCWSHREAS
jgi:transposase InsO family protein